MNIKFLASVATVAFLSTGVAYAQDNQKRDEHPAVERTQPNAGAAHDQAAPRAAQAEERRDETKGANPARAGGERNEMNKPPAQNAERPKAAEAPAQERQKAAEAPAQERMATQSGENERKGAEAQKRMAEPTNEKTPAERTGANERDRNAPRAAERNDKDHNAPRTAERNEPRGPARVEGNIKMSSEHATRVSESLRRDARPEHINVDVRVGVRAPEGVSLRPLPEDVIAIVPEYRGYDYFIDENDEIVFVAPQTHEVVGMIDYEGRAAADDNYTHVSASRPCPTEQ